MAAVIEFSTAERNEGTRPDSQEKTRQVLKLPPLSKRRYSREGALSLQLTRERGKSSARRELTPISETNSVVKGRRTASFRGLHESSGSHEPARAAVEEGRHADSRKRFKSLARMVKNQVVWKKGLHQAEEHLKTYVVQQQGDSTTEALTFNVNAFRPDVQACGGLSLRAKNILSKPSWCRTDAELQFLHRITLQLKCFERYPVYVRKELARVLCYESFEKGRVIIRQGDIGFSFYFILSGSVLVEVQEEDQVTGKKHNQIVGELEEGAAFGELALLHDSRRRATIVCKEPSEFLTIDKPDFDMVLRKNHEREWNTRLAYLKKHPLFAEWSAASLNFAVEGSQIAEYPANSIILKDLSVNSERIFIIVQGRCQIVQRVELSSDRNSLRIGQREFALPKTLEDCNRPRQLGHRDQQLITGGQRRAVNQRRWWVVRLLHPGEYFGVGEGREGMSILSDQKVECLLVNKMVFMRHNHGKCLQRMKEEAVSLYPSSDAVFRSYVETRKWRKYKEDVMLETIIKRTSGGSSCTSHQPRRSAKHAHCKLPAI